MNLNQLITQLLKETNYKLGDTMPFKVFDEEDNEILHWSLMDFDPIDLTLADMNEMEVISWREFDFTEEFNKDGYIATVRL